MTAIGDFLYVPASEIPIALSYGAVYAEGDARLRVPNPLPDGVVVQAFERWSSTEMRIIWLAEFLEDICGAPVDLLNVAGLLDNIGRDKTTEGSNGIPLYVPRFEMDRVRAIPGVHWDRRTRRYVADRTADFGLVFDYLTPAMRAVWIADRNLDTEIETLVKARALRYQIEGVEGGDRQELERAPEIRTLPSNGKPQQEDDNGGW